MPPRWRPFGLLLEDGESGSRAGGWMSVMRPHLEAAAETVLEAGDGVRRSVEDSDDLAPRARRGVEGVEELLLGTPCRSMNWMSSMRADVDLPVTALKAAGLPRPDGVDELVEQRLGRDVADPVGQVFVPGRTGRRLQRWVLPGPAAVDRQRVVATARGLQPPTGRQHVRSGWMLRSRTGLKRCIGGPISEGRAPSAEVGLSRAVGCGVPGVGEVDPSARHRDRADVLDLDLGDQSDLGNAHRRQLPRSSGSAASARWRTSWLQEPTRVRTSSWGSSFADVLEGRGPHGVADLLTRSAAVRCQTVVPSAVTRLSCRLRWACSCGNPRRAVMMGCDDVVGGSALLSIW